MKKISGGVCAAKGFTAAGIHAGVKAGSSPDKNDLALILSDCECAAAATFTNNRVKAAPVYTTMNHLENGILHGIIVNSGNANACAPNGPEHAEAMCAAAAAVTGRQAEDFAVASTGVIGVELNIKAIQDSVPALASALSIGGSQSAAEAIMTTDTVMKEIAVETTIGGKIVRLGAICKGAGMICPNMGTMLCFITSDCAITSDMLTAALHEVVPRTFNRVTVDGDTSTNDACMVLCNGSAGNPLIDWKDDNYNIFKDALMYVCTYMARAIAADGEGASHLLTCTVSGSRSEEGREARTAGRSGDAPRRSGSENPQAGGAGRPNSNRRGRGDNRPDRPQGSASREERPNTRNNGQPGGPQQRRQPRPTQPDGQAPRGEEQQRRSRGRGRRPDGPNPNDNNINPNGGNRPNRVPANTGNNNGNRNGTPADGGDNAGNGPRTNGGNNNGNDRNGGNSPAE